MAKRTERGWLDLAVTERKPARPVHYAAAFRDGLFFECYHRELRAYLDGPRKLTSYMKSQGYSAV